ncbi:hypothetical protein [Fictibacillus sp. S7]|nr:hypothetical protein [Fictibacillus sp. S7]
MENEVKGGVAMSQPPGPQLPWHVSSEQFNQMLQPPELFAFKNEQR